MCRLVGCLCLRPPKRLAPYFLPAIKGATDFGSKTFLPMELWLHVHHIIRTQFIARARKRFHAGCGPRNFFIKDPSTLRITVPSLQVSAMTWTGPSREIHETYATHFRKLNRYGAVQSCIVLIWRICLVDNEYEYSHFCMKVSCYITGDERYYTNARM